MKLWVCGLGILAASWSLAAQAQDFPVAEPITNWEADFAERDCGLKRHFLLGDGIVSLDIRRNAPNHQFRITVFAEKLERKGRKATTSFAGSDLLEHEFFIDLESGDWEGIEVLVPPDYFDGRAIAQDAKNPLSIWQAYESNFSLDLQDLGSALVVMDQCLDDLLTSWGVDPTTYKSMSRHVAAEDDDMEWFFSSIKPAIRSSFVREGEPVVVFLRVGANGRVTDCTMDGEVGESRAGERSCKNIKRLARFEPALDAEGQPIESFYTSTWRTRRTSPTIFVP